VLINTRPPYYYRHHHQPCFVSNVVGFQKPAILNPIPLTFSSGSYFLPSKYNAGRCNRSNWTKDHSILRPVIADSSSTSMLQLESVVRIVPRVGRLPLEELFLWLQNTWGAKNKTVGSVATRCQLNIESVGRRQ